MGRKGEKRKELIDGTGNDFPTSIPASLKEIAMVKRLRIYLYSQKLNNTHFLEIYRWNFLKINILI